MKSTFVMSVVGPDSGGNIKLIAGTTRKLEGEWLTSKVMRLDGQMTAMMKVVIAEENVETLKSELESQFPDLQFFYFTPVVKEDSVTKELSLVVDCIDRPGLTKNISTILSDLDLTVENMECNRCHVSSLGEAVFTAKLSLKIPETMDGALVIDELESMPGEVRVNLA